MIQDMKEDLNEDIKDILAKNQSEILEMQISMRKIKYSEESLTSSLDQIEGRILELEDEVHILAQSIEEKKRSMKSLMDHVRSAGQYWKSKPVNLVYRRC
jgi:predicted  nucleic acid-binding Zn-ribbon protein